MAARKYSILTGLGAVAIALMLMAGCGKEEAAQTEAPVEEMTEEEAAEAEAKAGMDKLTFETVTLDGEPVSQDIFSDKDLTAVYVWGTFCEPAIEEMGDYAKLYKELPDNANMVGIICDVYGDSEDYVEDAKKILGDAGAEFTNLRMSSDLEVLLYDVQDFPAAFFVDKEGSIVGEVMDGATFAETKQKLEENLQ